MTPASGARFGRMRIAIAAAIPAPPAASGVSASKHATATAHAAAAGTSFIGAISMKSIAGLVATIHAAAMPTTGLPMRWPIAYVANTSTPPQIGTTQNIAHWPAIALKPAMSSGSPGEYCGTMR